MEKTKLELFKEMVGTKLADIKQLFELPVVEPTVEAAKFVDVKTTDGVVLRISGETVGVGSTVMVVDEAGETPAADASYALEDGTIIAVLGGVISELTPVADEAPVADAPAEMNEVKESIKSITYKYAEIEKKLNETIEANKVAFEKVSKDNELLAAQNKGMFSLIESIAGLPTEEPTQTPKHTTKKGSLAEFRAEVQSIKEARKNNR